MDPNGSPYSITSRALSNDPTYHIKFRVKDTNLAEFEFGDVMPWYGKEGGAIQVRSSIDFKSLLDQDKIEIIEIRRFDSTTGYFGDVDPLFR